MSEWAATHNAGSSDSALSFLPRAAYATAALVDQHGRRKRKLRVSLTDRCNFRCVYCLPETPVWLPKASWLSDAERLRLLQLFVAGGGIRELRVTGGEPLLRPDLAERLQEFNALRALGLEKLALSTNAQGLAPRVAALKAAGLDAINISLDAVTPAGFAEMTGGRGQFAPVLDGIRAARDAGLPVKLNAVMLKGRNESEILPLAEFAARERVELRYIEFMPLDAGAGWTPAQVVSEAEIRAVLASHYALHDEPESDDPARGILLDGAQRVGIISTVTRPFCRRCDRLRLTADGQLFTCLFSSHSTALRGLLRDGADDATLLTAMAGAVYDKPAGFAGAAVERPLTMHALGG